LPFASCLLPFAIRYYTQLRTDCYIRFSIDEVLTRLSQNELKLSEWRLTLWLLLETPRLSVTLNKICLARLKNKSEAVQIYNTYIQDAQNTDSQACVELFKKLQQQEIKQAEEVRGHLQEVMQKGKM